MSKVQQRIEYIKQYQRKYNKDHPEQIKEQHRKYNKDHREQINEKRKERRRIGKNWFFIYSIEYEKEHDPYYGKASYITLKEQKEERKKAILEESEKNPIKKMNIVDLKHNLSFDPDFIDMFFSVHTEREVAEAIKEKEKYKKYVSDYRKKNKKKS